MLELVCTAVQRLEITAELTRYESILTEQELKEFCAVQDV